MPWVIGRRPDSVAKITHPTSVHAMTDCAISQEETLGSATTMSIASITPAAKPTIKPRRQTSAGREISGMDRPFFREEFEGAFVLKRTTFARRRIFGCFSGMVRFGNIAFEVSTEIRSGCAADPSWFRHSQWAANTFAAERTTFVRRRIFARLSGVVRSGNTGASNTLVSIRTVLVLKRTFGGSQARCNPATSTAHTY